MSDYRYKYQVIQALDDKIGRDLRKIVEGYLGPDPEVLRRCYRWAQFVIEFSNPTPLRQNRALRLIDGAANIASVETSTQN